jgi:hypothetical protein
MYDISFQPFSDAKMEKLSAGGIARFVREDKKWQLVFDKADLPTDIQIGDVKDNRGAEQPGYLTAAVNQIRSSDPTAEVLKNEVLDMGNLRLGMIVATIKHRPAAPNPADPGPAPEAGRLLMQQAMIQITPRPVIANPTFPNPPFDRASAISMRPVQFDLENPRVHIYNANVQQEIWGRTAVTLGYAGWSPGQLEHELSQNAWLTVEARDGIIFETPAEERLPAAMELLGLDYARLQDEAGHA